MTINQRRYQILRKVETGELSIAEGSRLLAGLDAGVSKIEETALPAEPVPPASPAAEAFAVKPEVIHAGVDDDAERRMKRWQRWWILPFGVGIFLTIISAVWMFQGYTAAGFGWRFWLSWFPFTFGLLLTVAAWYSQTLPWLHVRIRERGKNSTTNISLSLPLPIGLASWGLRRYKSYAPEQYEKVHLDEIMTVMNETLAADEPVHVIVDDEDDTHVEVFITGGRKR
ncbi:MAG TPA: hypothetical protein VLH85_04855 [Levilinea sp.]|nr:hypothetical protein [Levilinea sp.]